MNSFLGQRVLPSLAIFTIFWLAIFGPLLFHPPFFYVAGAAHAASERAAAGVFGLSIWAAIPVAKSRILGWLHSLVHLRAISLHAVADSGHHRRALDWDLAISISGGLAI